MNSHARCARSALLGFLCASFLLAPAASLGAELKEETLNAWDAYIQKANLEMGDRLHGPFLWVEEVPDRMQRVRAGDILVWSVGTQPEACALRLNSRLDRGGLHSRCQT